jgi:hypothetical protein
MPRVRPATASCGRGHGLLAARIFLLQLHFGFSAHATLRRLAVVGHFSLISFEADYLYARGYICPCREPSPPFMTQGPRGTIPPTSGTGRSELSLRRSAARIELVDGGHLGTTLRA